MKKQNSKITLESLFESIYNQFDNVMEIYVAHLPTTPLSVSLLHITVHTNSADSFEEYVDIVPASHVVIDIGEKEPLRLPFEVMATFDGPGHMQGVDGTTVYMSEDVKNAEPRELDDGLVRLRHKLSGVCPNCGKDIEDFGKHYRKRQECYKDERL